MRSHLEIVFGSAVAVALAFGAFGCSRAGSSQGASAPTTYMPYSTTNAGSTAYGNAGTGYSTPKANADDSGFDHGTLQGTGATDNTPSGVGGGPMDKGSTKPGDDVPKPLDKKSKGK